MLGVLYVGNFLKLYSIFCKVLVVFISPLLCKYKTITASYCIVLTDYGLSAPCYPKPNLTLKRQHEPEKNPRETQRYPLEPVFLDIWNWEFSHKLRVSRANSIVSLCYRIYRCQVLTRTLDRPRFWPKSIRISPLICENLRPSFMMQGVERGEGNRGSTRKALKVGDRGGGNMRPKPESLKGWEIGEGAVGPTPKALMVGRLVGNQKVKPRKLWWLEDWLVIRRPNPESSDGWKIGW